jgi:hypothetical protein
VAANAAAAPPAPVAPKVVVAVAAAALPTAAPPAVVVAAAQKQQQQRSVRSSSLGTRSATQQYLQGPLDRSRASPVASPSVPLPRGTAAFTKNALTEAMTAFATNGDNEAAVTAIAEFADTQQFLRQWVRRALTVARCKVDRQRLADLCSVVVERKLLTARDMIEKVIRASIDEFVSERVWEDFPQFWQGWCEVISAGTFRLIVDDGSLHPTDRYFEYGAAPGLEELDLARSAATAVDSTKKTGAHGAGEQDDDSDPDAAAEAIAAVQQLQRQAREEAPGRKGPVVPARLQAHHVRVPDDFDDVFPAPEAAANMREALTSTGTRISETSNNTGSDLNPRHMIGLFNAGLHNYVLSHLLQQLREDEPEWIEETFGAGAPAPVRLPPMSPSMSSLASPTASAAEGRSRSRLASPAAGAPDLTPNAALVVVQFLEEVTRHALQNDTACWDVPVGPDGITAPRLRHLSLLARYAPSQRATATFVRYFTEFRAPFTARNCIEVAVFAALCEATDAAVSPTTTAERAKAASVQYTQLRHKLCNHPHLLSPLMPMVIANSVVTATLAHDTALYRHCVDLLAMAVDGPCRGQREALLLFEIAASGAWAPRDAAADSFGHRLTTFLRDNGVVSDEVLDSARAVFSYMPGAAAMLGPDVNAAARLLRPDRVTLAGVPPAAQRRQIAPATPSPTVPPAAVSVSAVVPPTTLTATTTTKGKTLPAPAAISTTEGGAAPPAAGAAAARPSRPPSPQHTAPPSPTHGPRQPPPQLPPPSAAPALANAGGLVPPIFALQPPPQPLGQGARAGGPGVVVGGQPMVSVHVGAQFAPPPVGPIHLPFAPPPPGMSRATMPFVPPQYLGQYMPPHHQHQHQHHHHHHQHFQQPHHLPVPHSFAAAAANAAAVNGGAAPSVVVGNAPRPHFPFASAASVGMAAPMAPHLPVGGVPPPIPPGITPNHGGAPAGNGSFGAPQHPAAAASHHHHHHLRSSAAPFVPAGVAVAAAAANASGTSGQQPPPAPAADAPTASVTPPSNAASPSSSASANAGASAPAASPAGSAASASAAPRKPAVTRGGRK